MPDHRYWDRVQRDWQSSPHQELWRHHSDHVDTGWLSAWLPDEPVGRLLKTDLFNEGIGPGLFPLLRKAAVAMHGIDVSPVTARAAHARYRELEVATADVRYLPYAAGTFDLVISNSTLDHFEDAADIRVSLTELNRVLRTGGRLLISMDNAANPLVRLRNIGSTGALRRLGLIPYYVGATVGPKQFREALTASGFEVEKATAVMHCPRVLAVAGSRIVERFLGLRARRGWLRGLSLFENAARLPTRNLTGHFVVARARKVHG
jgi:SAM-dependent methyltransferase